MRTIHRGALAAVAGSAVVLVAGATPAFAGSITNPSTNPFTVPESTGASGQPPTGTPLPFDVSGSGYVNQSVFIEICDGTPGSANGWDPGLNCDNVTSPASVNGGSSGNVTFPANNPNFAIGDFRGVSPQDIFNCVAPGDIPAGTPKNANGSYTLPATATTTQNGETMDPSVPAWTNCQLRMSSNNAAKTSDQAFITLSIPDTPAQTPEAPFAILLPVGAAGLLGGGFYLQRRRRRVAAAA